MTLTRFSGCALYMFAGNEAYSTVGVGYVILYSGVGSLSLGQCAGGNKVSMLSMAALHHLSDETLVSPLQTGDSTFSAHHTPHSAPTGCVASQKL